MQRSFLQSPKFKKVTRIAKGQLGVTALTVWRDYNGQSVCPVVKQNETTT